MTQDVLAELLRRLDGWAGDAATRYERADEMVDVARRDLRAALVRTPETLDGYRIAVCPHCHEELSVRTPETLDAERLRQAIESATVSRGGTTTDCPLTGVHEHAFRGPHRFHEWDPAGAASPAPDPARNPSVEPYYLPMDCPVCGRRRMEWDGKVLSCEKCTTSSEWDGFDKERYQPAPDPGADE